MGFGNGWAGFGVAWMFGVLILAAVALLVVLVVRSFSVPGPPQGPNQPPNQTPGASTGGGAPGRARDILDERFARGELDEQEYRDRLRILNEGR